MPRKHFFAQSRTANVDIESAWMCTFFSRTFCIVLPEEQSMPFESFHSIIAIAFTAVWLMVGQFAFSKA